jgi:hypothetical protein
MITHASCLMIKCWRQGIVSFSVASSHLHAGGTFVQDGISLSRAHTWECIEQLKQTIQKKPFFMEIVILAVWAIWKTRNAYIFQHVTPSLYRTKTLFKEEFKWIKFRATRKSYHQFASWIDRFM